MKCRTQFDLALAQYTKGPGFAVTIQHKGEAPKPPLISLHNVCGTRVAIHRLVKKHRVPPVNPEELFLTSVMHSMDHLMTGNALLYRNLDTEKLRPHSDPHMMDE